MVGLIKLDDFNTQRNEEQFAGEADAAPLDRQLALRVSYALSALQLPILQTLHIEVRDGVVVLRGRVRNYYERQLAYTHAKRVPGVRAVKGEVSVVDPAAGIGALSLIRRAPPA